jgi:hypothetical protein
MTGWSVTWAGGAIALPISDVVRLLVPDFGTRRPTGNPHRNPAGWLREINSIGLATCAADAREYDDGVATGGYSKR